MGKNLFGEELPVHSGAEFSACERYRYALWRVWDHETAAQKTVGFIGLNPSTADATKNDPTVRRCIQFARDWGYGGMIMLNLFAYRATDPSELYRPIDPVGPETNEKLRHYARERCHLLIACWGAHPLVNERAECVRSTIGRRLDCLGLSIAGQPRHPLYMPGNCTPKTYWSPKE